MEMENNNKYASKGVAGSGLGCTTGVTTGFAG